MRWGCSTQRTVERRTFVGLAHRTSRLTVAIAKRDPRADTSPKPKLIVEGDKQPPPGGERGGGVFGGKQRSSQGLDHRTIGQCVRRQLPCWRLQFAGSSPDH